SWCVAGTTRRTCESSPASPGCCFARTSSTRFVPQTQSPTRCRSSASPRRNYSPVRNRAVVPAVVHPVDRLIAAEVPLLCQTAAGELTTSADRPAALLCGSFNPLHEGHLRLAETAAVLLQLPVAFELATINADKPPLQAHEVRRRLAQFVGRGDLWLTRL